MDFQFALLHCPCTDICCERLHCSGKTGKAKDQGLFAGAELTEACFKHGCGLVEQASGLAAQVCNHLAMCKKMVFVLLRFTSAVLCAVLCLTHVVSTLPELDDDTCLRARSLFFKKEMELSLIGLQNAGKTSLVNVVATGGFHEDMIPTVGFNMRKVTKGAVTIKLWDLGGQVHPRKSFSASILFLCLKDGQTREDAVCSRQEKGNKPAMQCSACDVQCCAGFFGLGQGPANSCLCGQLVGVCGCSRASGACGSATAAACRR